MQKNEYWVGGPLHRGIPAKMLLIMRMTLFVCLACCLSVAAKTSSQNITFTKKDATLKEVFSEIRKQTNYGVFYNQDLINDNLKVSVNANQEPLGKFMEQVLKNLAVNFLIEGQTIVISERKTNIVAALDPSFPGNTLAFTGEIRTGLVTDAATREPMLGVNITVKGKKQGTTTDLNGRYEISTEKEDVLLFSYVGYITKEVKVNGRKTIDVQMQSNQGELEDVVIRTGIFTIQFNK